MGFCKFCCQFLVLLVALTIGFFKTVDYPMGYVFRVEYNIRSMGQPMTEAVPADLAPAARPEKELFLPMPSGAQMPAAGIGMCCRPTAYDETAVKNTVLWYLLQGGRHIDTAAIYGNHVPIGQGIKEAIKRGVPRSEIFLVTKAWPDYFGYDATMKEVQRMLAELGVDYIDLVLMHMPRKISPRMFWHMFVGGEVDEFNNHGCENQVTCRQNTWKALSELREKGVVRDAGVSNFNIEQMKELQSLGLAPIAAHQIQYHPWLPDFQQNIVDFCNANKIVITAYFSLGGLQSKDKTLQVDALKAIGKKHSRSASQVLLRWALAKNVSIIPGTGNPHHMKENLGIYGFDLSPDEVASIDAFRTQTISDDFFFVKF